MRAHAATLASLAQGAQALPEIRKLLGEMDASLLAVLRDQLDTLEDITERILSTIVDEPPLLVREGGMIRAGANEEVDRLRAVQSGRKGHARKNRGR